MATIRKRRGVDILSLQIEAHNLPAPVKEFRFHPERRWRFDYCWPNRMIALEVEGGVWTQGRHTRGKGFLGDLEKYNEATLLGWRLFRVTPTMVQNGAAVELVKQALADLFR